jgi:hypothetical protein
MNIILHYTHPCELVSLSIGALEASEHQSIKVKALECQSIEALKLQDTKVQCNEASEDQTLYIIIWHHPTNTTESFEKNLSIVGVALLAVLPST